MSEGEVHESSPSSEEEPVKATGLEQPIEAAAEENSTKTAVAAEVKPMKAAAADEEELQEPAADAGTKAVKNNPASSPGRAARGRKAQRTRRMQLKEQTGDKVPDTKADDVENKEDDETDEGEETKDDDQEAKASSRITIDIRKIFSSLLMLISYFGSFLRRCCGLMKAACSKLYGGCKMVLPSVAAVGLFVVCSYLLATYCFERVYTVGSFETRAQYVVRASALSLIPIAAGR